MIITEIVGSFPVKGCNDPELTVNTVLDTAQCDAIQHRIAFEDSYRPKIRIGADDKGVAVVAILHNNVWKVWRRLDYPTHRVYDSHTLGKVYAFDAPGPKITEDYELSDGNIAYCRNQYSIQLEGKFPTKEEVV